MTYTTEWTSGTSTVCPHNWEMLRNRLGAAQDEGRFYLARYLPGRGFEMGSADVPADFPDEVAGEVRAAYTGREARLWAIGGLTTSEPGGHPGGRRNRVVGVTNRADKGLIGRVNQATRA